MAPKNEPDDRCGNGTLLVFASKISRPSPSQFSCCSVQYDESNWSVCSSEGPMGRFVLVNTRAGGCSFLRLDVTVY